MAMISRVLLCCLLLQVACGAAQAGQGLTPLPPAVIAPDFALPDTNGKVHRLSDYRGKTIIINFWATWCPPCREEIPSMNRAWQQLRQEDVVLLAVNMGEDEDTIFVFTADYPAQFPLLLDRDGAVTAQWPVKGLPTTFIVAPDGSIAYRAIGGRAWDDSDILETLRALQKQR